MTGSATTIYPKGKTYVDDTMSTSYDTPRMRAFPGGVWVAA